MNTLRLTHLTVITSLVAAAFMLQAKPVHAAPQGAAPVIVELPRVVVTGHRVPAAAMRVVELPRVEIVVRRSDAAAARLVQNANVKLAAAKPV